MYTDLSATNDAILASAAAHQAEIREQAWDDAAAGVAELADNPDLPDDPQDRAIYLAEVDRIRELIQDGSTQ